MKKKLDSDLVKQLRESKAKVGALLPVLVSSRTGRIIDGAHRIHSDKSWPVVKLDLDEKQGLIAKLSINALRHPLEPLDFDELGALLMRDGVKHGNVAHEIAKQTGVSYNTVLRNLDHGFLKQSNRHYSKEMKQAVGKRMSEAAAERHVAANDKPVEDIDSMTDSAESRVGEAVERFSHDAVQSYDALPKENVGKSNHSFVALLSALCDASTWIASMPAGKLSENYKALTANEWSAVHKKLEYLQANVMKLAAAFKVE